MSQTILRLPQVKARTGLSRSAIYAKMAEREFPPSIRLGKRAVGWDSGSIQSWIDQRIQESRKGEAA